MLLAPRIVKEPPTREREGRQTQRLQSRDFQSSLHFEALVDHHEALLSESSQGSDVFTLRHWLPVEPESAGLSLELEAGVMLAEVQLREE